MFSADERAFVAAARVGRLATVDTDGRPHAIPICHAIVENAVVSAIDEKPKDAEPSSLQRVRNVEANPAVALIVDRYDENWDRLGWVQVRGDAELVRPGDDGHTAALAALYAKYDQYREHDLDARPTLRIEPRRVLSWGELMPTEGGGC